MRCIHYNSLQPGVLEILQESMHLVPEPSGCLDVAEELTVGAFEAAYQRNPLLQPLLESTDASDGKRVCCSLSMR